MKKILVLAIVGLGVTTCLAQNSNGRFLIGSSINYSNDDLRNNSLLSNSLPINENNYSEFKVSGEFGYFLSKNSIVGVEIGYFSSLLQYDRTFQNTFGSQKQNIKTMGYSFSPKYKFVIGIAEWILFYTDINFNLQYSLHRNEYTSLNTQTYEFEIQNMKGNEMRYGLAIYPGVIFKINEIVGISIDYSLASIDYSIIKESDNSDINFDPIKAWDYNFSMNLSNVNLGVLIFF
jgi:hypothetical protein